MRRRHRHRWRWRRAEMGKVVHPCEGDLVCKSVNEGIPYFNAPIYLENKTQIGKIEEIFGPMTDVVRRRTCAVGRYRVA